MKKLRYAVMSALFVLLIAAIIFVAQYSEIDTIEDSVLKETYITDTSGNTKTYPNKITKSLNLSVGDALLTAENYARGELEFGTELDSPVFESQNRTHYLISIGISPPDGFGGFIRFYRVSKSTGEVTFITDMQNDWTYFEEYFGEFMDTSLNDYQLVEYAKTYLSTLKQLDSSVNMQYTSNNVKYLLADFSNDGSNELVACGLQDGGITYFELYTNNCGHVELIKSDHTGYAGHNGGISCYKNNYYVFYESWSSGDGFMVKLSSYDESEYSNPWKPINTAYEIDGISYVNECVVSEGEYENFRQVLMNTVLKSKDLYTIGELN